MHDLNDLYFYTKVVEHAGFTAASKAIHVPKSKLSRRIALLEERLGVRLIQRSSHRFAVTDIGQEYFRHCQAMLVEAEAAQELIDRTHAEPQGLVRISCPSALLYLNVADMLARFMVLCPRVQVQLEVTNRNVDPVRENIDIALRVRFPPLDDSDLVMKILAISTERFVAHPRLLAGIAPIHVPEDLIRLPSVGLADASQQDTWLADGVSGNTVVVRHQPRLLVNDMIGIHHAVLQGVGIAPLPLIMVHEHLKSGELVDLLPTWRPRSGIVQAVYPTRRGMLPTVRKLLDFLSDEFAQVIAADCGYLAAGGLHTLPR